MLRVVAVVLLALALAPGCAAVRNSSEVMYPTWTGFTEPNRPQPQMGLAFDEPYQAGKIPVLFIHGLLSDSTTWDEAITSLKSDDQIQSRYQFWTYQYPTGAPYLQTAAELRKELAETIGKLDPRQTDSALRHMVIVGHSMGGLIAKLQVTHSDEHVRSLVSEHSLDRLSIGPDHRRELEDMVYFQPNPHVRRVVYIATPHGGSDWSNGTFGVLGRNLIQFSEEKQVEFRSWVRKNATLLNDPATNIPTSIDHLAPDSPVIHALQRLRYSPTVGVHTIAGVGYPLTDWSDGDGVVGVKHAQDHDEARPLLVGARHISVHKHQESIHLLHRILWRHASESFE